MSWSLSLAAANKDEAKAKLAETNAAHGDQMPEAVGNAINDAIDAIPLGDDQSLSVATHGHFAEEPKGHSLSNITINIQTVIQVGGVSNHMALPDLPKLVEFGPAGTFADPLEATRAMIRQQLACTKPAYKPSLLVTTGLVPVQQAMQALGND